MPRVQRSSPAANARRLVKLWLPAGLVASMDDVIRETGAYNGREDFVIEAINDRIADERARPAANSQAPVVVDGAASSDPEGGLVLALWEKAAVVTAAHQRADEPMLGLHNRDYPTIWAADLLATIVAARGEPLTWMHYIARAASAAWAVSETLAAFDDDRTDGALKSSVGFPKNPLKRATSEGRFIEHMIGSLRQGKPAGPVFSLGLVGLADGPVPDRVAPTKSGLALLKALKAAGLTARPPHSPRAWLAFRDHLGTILPADLAQWMEVLKALAEGPTPDELAVRFQDRWVGSAVQTNTNGYVSRGREWGLVEPKLVDRRYRLTPLGLREVEEGRR